MNFKKAFIRLSRFQVLLFVSFVFCSTIVLFLACTNNNAVKTTSTSYPTATKPIPANVWKAPELSTIPTGKTGKMIRYGKDLLEHTAVYFGPAGTVAQISNGMNCQNCHLENGTKLFGNNYAGFVASYPKMSFRSGTVSPASTRISECFERSLNGKAPDTAGKEVQAIMAYMKWLGRDVKKGQKVFGTGSEKLSFLNRAADPAKGKVVYLQKCQVCHGADGEGKLANDKKQYTYPPLWGNNSYNDGAGMYRLGNLAGFVKNNMPFGASYQNPQLTDEQAWDVAAFVNSQPRPHRDQQADWPNLKYKPIDFPFGPYLDTFSAKQHKYGPYAAIKKLYN